MWRCSCCHLYWKYNWIYETNELDYHCDVYWGDKICDNCYVVELERKKFNIKRRFQILRDYFKLRNIIIYWLDISSQRCCAPGGIAFIRDLNEFKEFNSQFFKSRM